MPDSQTPPIPSSLPVLPLVEVAWADGRVADEEQQAILQAFRSRSINAFAWVSLMASEMRLARVTSPTTSMSG